MHFPSSPSKPFIICLVLTTFFLCPVLTQITTVYVDEKNSGSSPAGATAYRSLAEAIQNTGASGDGVEVLLVGDSVTIGSTIVIPSSSNYIVKPYKLKEGQTHFPFIMNADGFLRVDGAVLTLQQVQIIELDSTKSNPGILMGPDAVLNLNSILFKDYTNSDYYYPLVYKEDGDVPAELNIDNCVFSNIQNVALQFNVTRLTVTNTLFDNYRSINVGLIFVNFVQPDLDITFRNVTVQNSIFPEVMENQPYGFFYLFDVQSVSIEDFVVKNVTVASTYAFISINFEDPGTLPLPTISLSNIYLDGFFQSTDEILFGGFGGLGFQFTIAANVFVSNFQANNVHVIDQTLLEIIGQVKSDASYGNTVISDVVIQNSRNPIIFVSTMDTIRFERCEIYNNKYYGLTNSDHLFKFSENKAVTFTGLKGKNNTIPLVDYKNVYNITAQDWDLEDLKISQELDLYQQIMINMERSIKRGSSRLDIIRPWDSDIDWSVTTFQNIRINGFTEENGIDHTMDSNDTYLMRTILEFGKVYIKDSHFSNIEMGGIVASYVNYLSIDNLTYDVSPSISFNDIAKHKLMQLLEIGEVYITNSKFLNDKNVVLMTLFNLYRSSDRAEITQTSLYFENNEVTGNMVPYEDQGDSYTSLYVVRSPKNPVKVTFKNCRFEDNTVVNGIILNDESAKIDLDLLGNRFENNKALDSGVVLVADSMHNQFNLMNLMDNTFINNVCEKNGGVFLLNAAKYQITSRNNVYTNNRAKGSGGVGYVIQSHLVFSDTKSSYSGNSADNYGGAWYLSFKRQDDKSPQVTFIDTTFERSTALREGGAIYIAIGDVLIEGCKFIQNTANEGGGDIKLVTSSSLQVTQTESTGSSSPLGCFLNAEAISGEVVTIQNVQISNVHPQQPDSSIFALYSGSLVFTDSSIQDVSSPIFEALTASITMSGVSISQVACNSEKLFCVVSAIESVLTIQNSQVSNVISNQDIIVVSKPPRMTEINNIQMLDIRRQTDTQKEIFGISLNNVSSASIHDSTFRQFTMSSVKASNSNVNIANTEFSNARSSRILQQRQTQNSDSNNNNPRFIVLDTSSSQITGSSFIENSPAAQQDGGAIMILGTGGRHNIQKCTFQGNNGVNGGAVSVEGVIDSFNIEDSQFTGNQATGLGGSIYFNNDKGNKNTPVVTRTKFDSNKAFAGAGIYVKDYPLVLQDSEFTNNTARGGAAVASDCANTQRISSFRNKFISNFAENGAVFMAFGDLNSDNYESDFVGNKATHGGDISTKPFRIRLMVYQVAEAFLYLDRISTDYIKDHYETKLIYDSCDASIQNTIMMKSGRSPNLLFDFMVADELNQTISNIQKIEMVLDQKLEGRATSVADGKSLFGTTNYNVREPSASIFNSFFVRGTFGSSATLTVSAVAHDGLANNAYQMPPIEWQVVISPCAIGEVYDSATLICNPCPENSYSFEDPFVAKTCQECFDSAVCLGGNTMFPKTGYWRMSQLSDNFARCVGLGCLGGQSDEGRNISLTGFCAPGYEGVGCGSCSDGYVKSGGTNECLRCSEDVGMHIRYVAYFLFQIILTIFTIRSHMMSTKQSFKERYNDMLQSSIIKVVIDFLHVMNLTVAFNIDWPRELTNFMDFSSEVTPSNKDVFSIDCIINSARGTNNNIFFIKLLINIVQPIFFIIVASIVLVIFFKVTRKNIFNNEDFKEKIILTTVIIIYILQPDILKGTFQIFNCKNYGPTYDPKYYLVEDTSIECWNYQHLSWILGLAIPSFVLWLIAPCVAILSLLGKRRLTQSENFRRKYNFIFEKYKPNFFFWEVLVLMRKVILIVLSVFLTFTYLQAYMSFVTLIIAFLLQRKYKPYIKNPINYAEQISLYCSAGIMYSGLFFVRITLIAERSKAVVSLLLILDIIGGVIFFGFCIYVLKKVLIQKILMIKEKLDQVIDNDQFKWKQIRRAYRRIKQCLEPKNKVEAAKEISPSVEGMRTESAGKGSDEGQLAQNAKEGNENQDEADSNHEVKNLENYDELVLTSYGKVDSMTQLRNVDSNAETSRTKVRAIPVHKISIPEEAEHKENKRPSISIDLDLEERGQDPGELERKVSRYSTLRKSMINSDNVLLPKDKNSQ